jgi:hypothetical protein
VTAEPPLVVIDVQSITIVVVVVVISLDNTGASTGGVITVRPDP